MSKRNTIVALIVLAVLGLGAVGYFRAVPGLENQTDDYPQIEITPSTFDFGEVEYGAIAEHNFKIKNSGRQDLEIKKVATSCACTSAEVGKKTLKPGEETGLNVIYNTELMGDSSHAKGEQERIIYIKTNDPINPQVEIIIHAYVR